MIDCNTHLSKNTHIATTKKHQTTDWLKQTNKTTTKPLRNICLKLQKLVLQQEEKKSVLFLVFFVVVAFGFLQQLIDLRQKCFFFGLF